MGSRRDNVLSLATAGLLTFVMVFAGVAKLVGGHSQEYALPAWAYYAFACLECLALALFWWRWLDLLGCVAIVVAGAGILLDTLWPGRMCGCFGAWVSDPRVLWMLRGFVGLLGVMLLWSRRSGNRP